MRLFLFVGLKLVFCGVLGSIGVGVVFVVLGVF